MSSPPGSLQQQLPFTLSIAPFPEGFQGDMDETFQQAYALTTATVAGNFLTGLILPPGATLPTQNVGPVAMGGTWYLWDPLTSQYQTQAISPARTKNYARNSAYAVAQLGTSFTPSSGVSQTWDMALWRGTQGFVVTTAGVSGTDQTIDNDFLATAIQYTVTTNTVTTPVVTDFFAHEHLIEGIDLIPLLDKPLSLSFSAMTTVPGPYSAYLANYNRDASYVANFTLNNAGVWQRIKIGGIPPLATGTGTWSFAEGVAGLYVGIVLALGGQYKTGTPNTWLSGFFGGTSTNSNLLTTNGHQIAITGVKLEAAGSPTYYQVPPYIEEFEAMQRYYISTVNSVMLNGVCHQAGNGVFSWAFSRQMCKTPTVVPYDATATAGHITNWSSGASIAVANLTATRRGVTGSSAVTVTGATKGDVIAAFITADARLP